MAFSVAQQFAIDKYRSFFSMRTQMAAGSSFKLPNRLGDEELWEDLRFGINFFNSSPPIVTTFSFQEIYDASSQAITAGQDPMAPESESTLSIYISAVFMCAMFFTGTRLEWFEAGKHFRYNDNGISIERVKQPDYQNVVGSSVLQFITTVLPGLRKTLGFERINIKGQFSGMISFPRSLTRGLRGTRLGAG